MKTVSISLPNGEILGCIENEVLKLRGVPYCEPPVGKNRLAPTRQKSSWSGILDCTAHGAIAPQCPSDLDEPMGAISRPQSEDCLTLTINIPADVFTAEGNICKELPVAVWLHGGAFFCGAGSLDWYDGARLALEGNMIVVGVNYRLGPLGFLHYPGINDLNLAILDQIEALKWVKKNISALGGDPNRVTLFGQSAGANSIVHLLSVRESAGLFNQIVLLSPSLGRGAHLLDDAHKVGREFLKCLDCNTDSIDLKQQILDKSPQDFVNAFIQCTKRCGPEFGGMIFKPVLDSWHEPKQAILSAAQEAAARNLRIIIGTTHDETWAFSKDRTHEGLERLRVVQQQRFDGPATDFALQASRLGCSVWKYRFDWKATKSVYGACHCIDLPFLFGRWDAWHAPMLRGLDHATFEQIGKLVRKPFIDFVHGYQFTQDQWPLFSIDNPLLKIIDANGSVKIEHTSL